MGTYHNGILGRFSGNVGAVSGSTWKGIDVLRSIVGPRSGPSSVKQVTQQSKFALIVYVIQTMTDVLHVTFKKYAVRMSEYNAASSYGLKNAITGVYPSFTVNYQNLLVGRGSLPNAEGPTATAAGGGIINFAWTDNSGIGTALDTDTAVVVAYCPALHTTLFDNNSATRASGGEKLNVSSFVGQTVETWVTFFNEDGKDAANSIFTGELTVS